MLNVDVPDHTRLRLLVQKAFTPRMIETLRSQLELISNQLLDEVESVGSMDIISDYAYPLPIMVICELLGIPSEDRTHFKDWSKAIVSASNHPNQTKRIVTEVKAFVTYLKYIVEKRRKSPGKDLISLLIQAESEGSQLTATELYSMIFLLLVAGHETTVNLIGNGVFTLLQHKEQLQKLKNNPNLLESAIEEILRYSSPVEITTSRWASEDILFQDTHISKGDMILIGISSANRDPDVFPNPDQFDISRTPNKHIAFGLGTHFCLGAPLARLEGQIAISTLLRRFGKLKLASSPSELEYQPGILMRGFIKLPLTFELPAHK